MAGANFRASPSSPWTPRSQTSRLPKHSWISGIHTRTALYTGRANRHYWTAANRPRTPRSETSRLPKHSWISGIIYTRIALHTGIPNRHHRRSQRNTGTAETPPSDRRSPPRPSHNSQHRYQRTARSTQTARINCAPVVARPEPTTPPTYSRTTTASAFDRQCQRS